MTKQEILSIEIKNCDIGNTTIRGYLKTLLTTLWKEEESFNSKRPFGNSGWQYNLYKPLALHGLIPAIIEDDGDDKYVEIEDYEIADKFVLELIEEVFKE